MENRLSSIVYYESFKAASMYKYNISPRPRRLEESFVPSSITTLCGGGLEKGIVDWLKEEINSLLQHQSVSRSHADCRL
jgi:hypothetical protein